LLEQSLDGELIKDTLWLIKKKLVNNS